MEEPQTYKSLESNINNAIRKYHSEFGKLPERVIVNDKAFKILSQRKLLEDTGKKKTKELYKRFNLVNTYSKYSDIGVYTQGEVCETQKQKLESIILKEIENIELVFVLCNEKFEERDYQNVWVSSGDHGQAC